MTPVLFEIWAPTGTTSAPGMSVFPVLPSFKTICSYNTPFSRGMRTIVANSTHNTLSSGISVMYWHEFVVPFKSPVRALWFIFGLEAWHKRKRLRELWPDYICSPGANQSNLWTHEQTNHFKWLAITNNGRDGDEADDDHGWWWWLWRRRRRRFHSDAQCLPQDHFQIPSLLSFEEFQHWLLSPIHPN